LSWVSATTILLCSWARSPTRPQIPDIARPESEGRIPDIARPAVISVGVRGV
jgi:hypothetical protein